MRIAVASSGLGHVARGIEAWANDLGHALHDRAAGGVSESVLLCKGAGTADHPWERVIACARREGPLARRLLGLLPSRLTWRLGLASGYGIEQSSFALALIDVLRHERIDLLHTQDPRVALLVQTARQLGVVPTRTVLAHGTEEPADFLKRIVYLQHLAPWHLDEARRVGAWRPTWTAIPNFIDADLFRPGRSDQLRRELGIPGDGLIVLTAAAIKRGHKRIDYLLSEFARLRTQSPTLPVWLVVAGGWEAETDGLIAEGRRLLGDRVRFLVRFPRARMPDLYRAADVFVLCSLKEMMPIAVLEALASGVPCVVNRHPVLEWMVGDGGRVVDLSGPSLADEVGRLLGQPSGRAELARLARRQCVTLFGRDRVVGQIVDYYRAVLADPPVARPSARRRFRTLAGM